MSHPINTAVNDIADTELDALSAGRSIFDPFIEVGQIYAEIGRGILNLPKEIGRALHPKS